MNKFSHLKIWFSPFKRPRLRLYIGRVARGVPYFLPTKRVQLRLVGLGWKTKWSPTDYRHEWNPQWSLTLFGLQFHLEFEQDDQYWESWLYWEMNTDRSLPRRERVQQLVTEFPQIWSGKNGEVDKYKYILKNY